MSAWPAAPLVGILLALLMFAVAFAMNLLPPILLIELPDPQPRAAAVALEASDQNTGPRTSGEHGVETYQTEALRSSLFSPERRPFSRILAPPEETAPLYEPEFVGTMGSESDVRVLIIWKKGEVAQIHKVGDQTPWGVLKEITKGAVVFIGPEGERELRMF